MNWGLNNIAAIFTIVLGLVAIILYIKGFSRPPTETLRLLPLTRSHATFWHMGSMNKKPAMQICADIRVTNIHDQSVLLSMCKIRKPITLGNAHPLHNQQYQTVAGERLIVPGTSVEVRCDLWVQPPVKEEGQDYIADLAIVDQFGNHHWMKKVKFVNL